MPKKKKDIKRYTRQTLGIYFRQMWKYKWPLLLTLVGLLGTTAVQVYIPVLFKNLFNLLAYSSGDANILSQIFGVFRVIALFMFLEWILQRTEIFAMSYFSVNCLRDLSNRCFEAVHKQGVPFFENSFIGSLVKKVNRFVWAFQSVVDSLVWTLLPAVALISFISFSLYLVNPWFPVIVVAWVSFFVFVNIIVSKYKMKHDLVREELDSKMSGSYADTFTNHTTVKFFSGTKREIKGFKKLSQKWREKMLFSWNISTINGAIQGLLVVLLELGIFYYAIMLWKEGILTIGDFTLLQGYIMLILRHIWMLGRVIRDLFESLSQANEMTEIFERPLDVVDAKNAEELKVPKGEVVLDNISFYYKKTRKIFKNLRLKIKPGSSIAFVGHSGAGKSSLIKLFLRQYDVQKGKILIDGKDIKKVTQESLWKNIAFVPQDPILFHRSLLENIRYGRPEATKKEVIEAAKKARCHEFITKLDKGYETLVGERGVKLSGGERQRVAIARAILKNAPILILDEATSSLDSESEKCIQDALEYLMKDKTVMVIAHRLSTIMKMDRIIVLDDGEIVEDGSHRKLLKKKRGVYRKLWDLQAGGFIE